MRTCASFIDERQAKAKIDEWAVVKTARNWTKCDWAVSFIDELQLKSENRWATNGNRKQMSDKWKAKTDER